MEIDIVLIACPRFWNKHTHTHTEPVSPVHVTKISDGEDKKSYKQEFHI